MMYDASIVIPVYNQFKPLKIVMQAFHNQNYEMTRFEVIIIDDGSSDDLKNIVCIRQLIEQANMNCTFIHTTRRGRSAARNTGVVNAKSNIIIFNDADRIPEKDFVGKHIYKQNKNDVVIGNSKNIWSDISQIFLPIDKEKKCIRESYFYSRIKKLFDDKIFYSKYRWLTLLIGNSSIKKDVILQAGGFDENIIEWGLEHFDLGIRLQLQNIDFIIANEIENYHIYHERNQNKSLENAEYCFQYLQKKYKDFEFANSYNYIFANSKGEIERR